MGKKREWEVKKEGVALVGIDRRIAQLVLYIDQVGAYRVPHTPARGTGGTSSGVG
jgi:hypothetical protein